MNSALFLHHDLGNVWKRFEGSQHADGTVTRVDLQHQTMLVEDKLDTIRKIPTYNLE